MKTIFVAIASYRDTECQWTIKSMYDQAKHPERIYTGVLWQVTEEDADCFIERPAYPSQVLEVVVDARVARGAGWGKSRALMLNRQESYTLLIDSHMRFMKDWDQILIDMIESLGGKSLISTYPPPYTPPNELTPYLSIPRPGHFDDNGMVINSSIQTDINQPTLHPLVAGGFMFAPTRMFNEIPYDPHMYFHGEEIAYAVRLYTNGWDVYAPHMCVILHYYGRDNHKRQWSDDPDWMTYNMRTIKRVKHLLGVEMSDDPESLVDIKKYGLGSARTLQEFQDWSGYRFAECVVRNGAWDIPKKSPP